MNQYERLKTGESALSLVGLGYVGLPIAVEFAKRGVRVIGYDRNEEKIQTYRQGLDPTGEVGDEAIRKTTVRFTADERDLQEASFHIVAVPTPVGEDHTPDLSLVREASRMVGRNLTKGSVVVFESTVYPGVTEDVCAPILERESGLCCGKDFFLGYSPERINPGDPVHRLSTIQKIVSGMDAKTLDLIAKVYELVVDAGVYRAESIRVAEAAKVIENSQRDINIAFMNELSMIFHRLGIDTQSVLRAAGTKWNFLPFTPGLVGGHCIGVDPYYLTYLAETVGYHSSIILPGRRVNDNMGAYVAKELIKSLAQAGKTIPQAKVAILGITFKENCPDTRNTKVMDVVQELEEYGIKPLLCDPVADAQEAKQLYGVDLVPFGQVQSMDALVLAVPHRVFSSCTMEEISRLFAAGRRVLFDLKGVLSRTEYEEAGYDYWRL